MSDVPTTNINIYHNDYGINLFIKFENSPLYQMIFKLQVQYFEITFIKFDKETGELLYKFMFYHPNGDENEVFLKNQLSQLGETDNPNLSSIINIFEENDPNNPDYILKNDVDYFKYALLQVYIDPMGLYLASIQGSENEKSKKLNEYEDLCKNLINSNKWFGVLIELKGLTGSEARYKHSLIF